MPVATATAAVKASARQSSEIPRHQPIYFATFAGMFVTISGSKDYPADLVYDWLGDEPVIQACSCTHEQSCRICARRIDNAHGLAFRDMAAAI